MAGQPLDAILRKDLIGSRDDDGTTNYESISFTGTSDFVDSSRSEQGMLLSIDYENGAGLVVSFSIEGSIDGVSYAPIDGTPTAITDTDGSIVWDLINLNANFIRLAWDVTSGSVDVYGQYSAKRRH